jgi:glutamine amidotransferase
MINVGIVDYGLGNIASVANALEEAGANVSLVSNQNGISKIDKLVLPGVGSFQSAAFELASKGLDDALREFANRGKPILGICLGMQLFFDEGEELGVSQGLSLIPGRVKKMSGAEFKLPHIGKNLPQSPEVYFLHSYSAHLTNEEDLLALSKNGQFEFVAAVQHKNIYGCQFHPEKSGQVGLEMLKNFIGI